ncbi:serine carboxypeptidase domain-containing protein [Rhizoctonia solani AG-1 IA]|uniref:Serine carboxypeptidase domain-containing protein n=1 Tax=Thanatephorus cucumeris (strain AG1-IA) TaxID=983506 RepID=L8WJA7_THACA|nr:serine carboxypeptidase domain-containing protein [Rhizoctonia solani AG-1 IA]
MPRPQRRTLERGQQYSHPSSYASDMDFSAYVLLCELSQGNDRALSAVGSVFLSSNPTMDKCTMLLRAASSLLEAGEEDKTTPFFSLPNLVDPSSSSMVRLSSLLLCVGAVSARLRNPRDPRDRYYPHAGPPSIARSSADEHTYAPRAPELPKRATTISFANPKAAQYLVDGTKIPEVDFDVGPSWSGLMPISGNANETRKLFFWFWPTTNENWGDAYCPQGGPGCSSLEGLLQENGPFTWPTGTAKPIRNQWSHVLWVEQPVGTGFSQGIPNITNEDQLAAQFAGFLAQFLEVFSELKGKNFYATGESYAGVYVPYIANYLYENPKAVDLKLKGTWITDPAVSYDLTPFVLCS